MSCMIDGTKNRIRQTDEKMRFDGFGGTSCAGIQTAGIHSGIRSYPDHSAAYLKRTEMMFQYFLIHAARVLYLFHTVLSSGKESVRRYDIDHRLRQQSESGCNSRAARV